MTTRFHIISYTSWLISLSLTGLLAFASLSLYSQTAAPPTATLVPNDQPIEVVIVQLNDVYEIAPVQGGQRGGMARVATLCHHLRKQNPLTFVVLSGDFISPSVFAYVSYQGKPIRGAQMIDVMNAIGIDYVTFGNHEFDIPEAELQERINESKFSWIATNVRQVRGKDTLAFRQKTPKGTEVPLPEYAILRLQDRNGQRLRLGLLGVTLPYAKKPYVHYLNVNQTAKATYQRIQDSCDAVIAMTHLSLAEDKALATALPQVPLLMGGHEHDHIEVQMGPVRITKADANAKTVYIHRLRYDPSTKQVSIQSMLQSVDESIPADTAIQSRVNGWMERAYASFRSQGFEPTQLLATFSDTLNGLEAAVRNQQTNLGALICRAMAKQAVPNAIPLLNSGSIRIDDQLPGKITQYDILRTLPFGGAVVTAELQGRILRQSLDAGLKNKGTGGYLQTLFTDLRPDGWYLHGKPIVDDQYYPVVLTDFLLAGKEANLGFLSRANPLVRNIIDPKGPQDPRRDIRHTVIHSFSKP
jgi:2',3'-cyclic-nucleotide 2'-phosphodiesterase (5'-nucleotidase family)